MPHRRGGPLSARSGMNSGPASASWTSARRIVRVCAAVDQAPQELKAPVVTIRIPYRVNFGEVVKVVGSSAVLGDWSADRGLQLTWNEGDVWAAEVPVSAGHYEFKCVVYNVTTNSVTRWEDGGNRVLNISAEPGTWDVACQWGATADMTQAFTPAPPLPPPPPAEPETAPAAATDSEVAVAEASGKEELQTFLALESAAGANQAGEAAPTEDDAAATAASAGAAAPADADAAASSSGSGGGAAAAMLLLATCAAGAVAAYAFLAPGGLEASALGGRASQAVSSTLVGSSLAGAQSQLAALAGQVSAVQAQMASVSDGLAALQPIVRNSVSFVQGQATTLQSRATAAAAADAVAGTVELSSRNVARQS